MYLVYDSFFGEYDVLTEADLENLRGFHPGRFEVVGELEEEF